MNDLYASAPYGPYETYGYPVSRPDLPQSYCHPPHHHLPLMAHTTCTPPGVVHYPQVQPHRHHHQHQQPYYPHGLSDSVARSQKIPPNIRPDQLGPAFEPYLAPAHTYAAGYYPASAQDMAARHDSMAYYPQYPPSGCLPGAGQELGERYVDSSWQQGHPRSAHHMVPGQWPASGLAPSLHLVHSHHQVTQQQAFFERPPDAQQDMLLQDEGFAAQLSGYGDAMRRTRSADVAALEQSGASQAYEYHDHPSFGKPPHHRVAATASMGPSAHGRSTSVDAALPGLAPASDFVASQHARKSSVPEPQIIAEGASAIPPPPSLEKSAHPLAGLATDLVWEAFLAAANSNSGSGYSSPVNGFGRQDASPSRWQSDESTGRSHSSRSPQTPHFRRGQQAKPMSPAGSHDRSRSISAGRDVTVSRGFGAIGGERKPARIVDGSPSSEISSPASSAPGTPNFDGTKSWTVHTNDSHQRLARYGWDLEDAHTVSLLGSGGKDAHALSSSSSTSRGPGSYHVGTPAAPYALFDQIQKLLGATLLSQQVLLLALYFVVKIPHTSPLYPPATSQSALLSTSAPFKLLLAALVVANKHLDDNSFRNSTFATVSNISLPEVNALEYSLLAGIGFDINVDTETWLTWLRDLESQHATIYTEAQPSIASSIRPLIEGVIGQQQEQDLARYQLRHPGSLAPVNISALSPTFSLRPRKFSLNTALPPTPKSEHSHAGSFDMDAAGPLEDRPRYTRSDTVKAYQSHPTCAEDVRMPCGGSVPVFERYPYSASHVAQYGQVAVV